MDDNNNRRHLLNIPLIATAAVVILFYYLVQRFSGFLGLIRSFLGIIAPMLAGFVLAFLMNPIMTFFEERVVLRILTASGKYDLEKMEGSKSRTVIRTICTLLSVLILILFFSFFLQTILPQFFEAVQSLSRNLYAKIAGVIDWANGLTGYRFNDAMQAAKSDERISSFIANVTAWLRKYFEVEQQDQLVAMITRYGISAGNAVLDVIIGLFIAVYLIIDKEKYKGYIKRLIYASFNVDIANRILRTIRKSNEIFYGFIIGKIIDSVIIGIICYFCMLILGLPYTMLCSFIIGVTNVIPVFGPYIGAIPTVILIFVTNPPQGIIFLIFVVILQQVDGNLIGPKILGDSTGISSFWVIVAILLGGGLFGVVGMIIGVPTVALILNLINEITDYRTSRRDIPRDPAAYIELDHIDTETGQLICHEDQEEEYVSTRMHKNLGRIDTKRILQKIGALLANIYMQGKRFVSWIRGRKK